MKANPKMVSWSLRQQLFAGNPAPEANYFSLIGWDGASTQMDPASRDEPYKATTGMTYAQQQEKLADMREVGGSAISRLHDTVGRSEQGNIAVAQRYRTAPRRTTELAALMHDFRLPMVTERTKGDGGPKYWAYSHLALAASSSEAWDSTITRATRPSTRR